MDDTSSPFGGFVASPPQRLQFLQDLNAVYAEFATRNGRNICSEETITAHESGEVATQVRSLAPF